MPASFREMPRWWNDALGREWLDRLPQLIHAQCAQWRLTLDGASMHGSNALVVPVRRGAERLVLRMTPPGDDVGAEAAALRFWDGRGTVRLHDVDERDRSMLLERLDGRLSLASRPLRQAVLTLAELVTRLAIDAPETTLSTREIAARHAATFEAEWDAVGRPVPRGQLDQVIAAASERASETPSATAVDGDLHFTQVLAGEREPWLVVDPVLLSGDREYDLGRILWSRIEDARDDAELRALFDSFVDHADVPAARARAWVVIRSASYLFWGLARGLTEDPPKCRRLLDVFL